MGNTASTPRMNSTPNLLSTSSPHSVRVWRPSADSTTGALLYPDGSCYYGELSLSTDPPIRSGFGIYLDTTGHLQEGTFIDDHIEGDCVITNPDGESFLATYSNGVMVKQGPPQSPLTQFIRNAATPALDTPSPRQYDSVPITPTSVHQWLVDLHMEKYEDRFRGHENHQLPRLRDKLRNDNMPYGHRARLISNLGRLSFNSTGGGQSFRKNSSSPQPVLYVSAGSSSNIYVPRAPSRPDKWLIPPNQLSIESRISSMDDKSSSCCLHCSQLYRGTWLGKDVVIRQYTNVEMNSKFLELLSRMAKIRHPNICLFMAASYSEQSKTLSIVTEFVYHGSLDKFKSKNQRLQAATTTSLSTQTILHLSRGIAVGCMYLRKQGFSHKNLKPSNILIDAATLDVKLTDYFIMEFDDLFHYSKICTKQIVPRYVAPESLRRIPFVPFGIDSASDVYSFGLIIWELVTGRKPFENFSIPQIRVLVGFAGYKEPRARLPTLRSLPKLIEKCISHDPTKRHTFERLVVALSCMHKSANSAAEDALITFISGR